MLHEAMFDGAGVAINYAEGPPSGTPLVMLHGISGWWKSFLPVLPQLAFRWHVFATDFRGHGRSGRVAHGYRWEAFAADTIAFLRERVGEPAFLLGHSLGAMTALRVAAEAPEIVRAVVLEDPGLYGYRGARLRSRPTYKLFVAWNDLVRRRLTVEELAAQLATVQPDLDAAALRLKARSLSFLDPEVLGMYLDGSAVENYDTDALLPKVTCPVLLMRGEVALGGAIEDEDERRVLSLLPRPTLVRVAGVGHFIHSQKPERYCQVVTNFLESLDGADE